ncbi:MAG: hypothetical protein JNK82_10015 [Myxococcaceae bacterium]|nr:hypothetical protein [Myxococcaceae bacterium]
MIRLSKQVPQVLAVWIALMLPLDARGDEGTRTNVIVHLSAAPARCSSSIKGGPATFKGRRRGTIRGRIETLDGGPLVGVVVQISGARRGHGTVTVSDEILTVEPDGNGNFAIVVPDGEILELTVRGLSFGLVSGNFTDAENPKLAKHVFKHQARLLEFLDDASIPPAEHEVRGAVVLRKIGGCHRAAPNAHAHAILASHAQTAQRRGETLDHHVTRWMALHSTSGPPRPRARA